jgi:hypothetical protein
MCFSFSITVPPLSIFIVLPFFLPLPFSFVSLFFSSYGSHLMHGCCCSLILLLLLNMSDPVEHELMNCQ